VQGVDLRSGFIPIRWPDATTGPFVAAIRLAEIRGRFEVAEVSLGSLRDDRAIDGRVLRRVRLAELAAVALDRVQRQDLLAGALDPPELLNAAEMTAEWLERRELAVAPERAEATRVRDLVSDATKGRRYPPGHLSAVAEIYRDAHRRRQAPTKAVAEAMGISRNAAAKLVARAREKHLLGPTTPGRAAVLPKWRRCSRCGVLLSDDHTGRSICPDCADETKAGSHRREG
jgi:ribosomal protein S27AE